MKEELKEKFINLIRTFGHKNEMQTFSYCSEYGFDLAGSTIDRIQIIGNDSGLCFVYNENTNDYDTDSAFTDSQLEDFFTNLEYAVGVWWRGEQEEHISELIDDVMMYAIPDAYDRTEFVDNIIEDVKEDMAETADPLYWNDDDVRISTARILVTLSQIGK